MYSYEVNYFVNFQNEAASQSKYQDFPKSLHPYDRSSESLFLVIVLEVGTL